MTTNFDISIYRNGYSVGVGGVVRCGDKVLLTRFALGANKGEWAIPGGFVERNETIDAAIKREIFEETSVKAEIEGLIAVRSRITRDENSAYFIFLLRADNHDAQPDGVEIQEARYFTFEEIQNLSGLRPLSKLIITRVFENKVKILTPSALGDYPLSEFVLFS